MRIHQNFDDPAAVKGTDEERSPSSVESATNYGNISSDFLKSNVR
jgi:hypothetical protein